MDKIPNNLNKNLKKYNCSFSDVSKIENLPSSLTILWCNNTQIRKIENLPLSLIHFYCSNTQITKIDNLPPLLTRFWSYSNTKFTKIENLPPSLIDFYISWENIKYIDNIEIDKLNFYRDDRFLREYNIIKRLQRRMKIRYRIKNEKARIIQAGCENWLYKPPNGIVPRLEMKKSGVV